MRFNLLQIYSVAKIVGNMANVPKIDVENAIKENKTTLLSIIDANDFLLTELVGEGVMDEPTKEVILAGSTPSEVNRSLLEWLSEHPSSFNTFLMKLRQHRQIHVANLLDGTPGELPLKPELKQKLQKMMRTLTLKIDPDTRNFIDSLFANDCISEEVYEEIKAKTTKQLKNKRLLEALIKGSDKTYEIFLKELEKTDQKDIWNILDSSDDQQEVVSHTKPLKEHSVVLKRCTDVNVLTIAHLRSRNVIDDGQEAKLKAEQISHQKIDLIHGWLHQKSSNTFREYIHVMNENEQRHVANLLTGNSQGQQPMSLANYEMLKEKSPILIKGIYSRGPELASALRKQQASQDTDYAISHTDFEEITQGNKIDSSRNAILIDSVLRRTDFSLDSLIKALVETHQENMADYITQGEVVGTHINTTRPDKDDDLAKAFNEAIHMPSSAENQAVKKDFEELNGYSIPIVAAESQHSIMVYTYCKTPDDMKRFVKLFNCGRLQVIYENILNELLKVIEPETPQTLEAALTLEEEDKQLIQDFTGLDDSETDMKELPCITKSHCQLHDLPMDIYCYDCKEVICPVCVQESHKAHKNSGVVNLRKQLQDDLGLIGKNTSNVIQLKEKIENEKAEFLKKLEDSEKAIIGNCEELKEKVDMFKRMLLQEHASNKEKMLVEYDNRRRAIESFDMVIEDYKRYMQKLLEKGSAVEICQSYPGLHDRAAKLKKLLPPTELIRQFDPKLVAPNISIEITEESISKHAKFIEEWMEPDFGLLDQLHSSGALSKDDFDAIRKMSPKQTKNKEILKIVLERNKCDKLGSALAATRQMHLINYLLSNGEYNPVFGEEWPISDQQMHLLEGNLDYLFGTSEDILTMLYSTRVINDKQKEFISSKETAQKKSEALLGILRRGSISDFNIMRSLLAANQTLMQRREFLKETMEPEFGLLQELSESGALSQKDIKLIEKERILTNKNAKILEIIFAKNKYNELITALSRTKQMHIVNYLNSNGVYHPKFGGEWPLTPNEVSLLDAHRKQLVEKLNTRSLLDKLQNKQVISVKQKECLSLIKSYRDRNEELIEMIRNTSINNYKKTLECLCETDQSDLARLITPPVRAQVSVEVQMPVLNVKKEFAELLNSFNRVLVLGQSHSLKDAV